jgi:PTS system nitrogen regulatory IIA component
MQGRIENENELVRVLAEREALGSTGIGDGVAIPHGKLNSVTDIIVAFGRSARGVEYESLDAQPVFLFFLLVTPGDRPGDHLKTLARISRIFKNPTLRTRLMQASGRQEMRTFLFEEDSKYPQPLALK